MSPIIQKTKFLTALTFLFLFFLVASAFAETKKGEKIVDGSLSTQYKFRTTGDIRDQDIQSILSLNFLNPRFDKVSGALQVGGQFDLDGQNDAMPYFTDIYQTWSQNAVPRFYYGYVNFKDVGAMDHIRFGRQRLQKLETYHFDGLSMETTGLAGFVLSVFGGVPVHLYENKTGFDPGDWLAGGSLQWTPITKLRMRADFAHITDTVDSFTNRSGAGNQFQNLRLSQTSVQDNLLGFSMWFTINEKAELFARFTGFTDKVRDLQLASTISLPKQKLTVRAKVYRQLTDSDFRVGDFDAFSLTGNYQPFTQLTVDVTKAIGKYYEVNVGSDVRVLDGKQEGAVFNHGFRRGYLNFATHDLFWKGLEFRLGTDYYWGVDNSLRNSNFALSFSTSKVFEYGKEIGEDKKEKGHYDLSYGSVSVSLGTAYYLYRYNLLMGNESDDVRTYFADVEWKMARAFKFKLGYELEDNKYNVFHMAKSSFVWNF